jgi:hypothetical protein
MGRFAVNMNILTPETGAKIQNDTFLENGCKNFD